MSTTYQTIETKSTFEEAYCETLALVASRGVYSDSRTGKGITELTNVSFSFKNPMALSLPSRLPSEKYTIGELEWYMSGSYDLEDAAKLSNVWTKCSDDGERVNSNYGALVFHERNSKGLTCFEHAVNCLASSASSKKAVIPIYAPEHSYLSKDNPCTMYLHFRIQGAELHCNAVMRSNDLFFGTPYDVRFFVFVQWMIMRALKVRGVEVTMGTYTHFSHSIHFYREKHEKISEILGRYGTVREAYEWARKTGFSEEAIAQKLKEDLSADTEVWTKVFEKFEGSFTSLADVEHAYMEKAWSKALESTCKKKKVGAVFVERVNSITEVELCSTFGGAMRSCEHCARDDAKDKYYGDDCPAVHSEMKGVVTILKRGIDPSKVKVYLTHGPCDACLKLLDLVGIKEVVYDEPYKTDLSHWPNINVRRLLLNNGNTGKPPEVDNRIAQLRADVAGKLDGPSLQETLLELSNGTVSCVVEIGQEF